MNVVHRRGLLAGLTAALPASADVIVRSTTRLVVPAQDLTGG